MDGRSTRWGPIETRFWKKINKSGPFILKTK